jgi:prepilin-type N-terminal cleavage/methylation domain-containing protein
MRRDSGFTLLELAVAIFIMVIIMMMAVPTLNGVMADRRLRRSLDGFNRIVRQAQELSVTERRAYLIIFREGKVGLRPEGLMKDEDPTPVAMLTLNRGESLKLAFPAAMMEDPPPEWIFWPSGNCEPAVVTFRGRDGAWTANYSALTARAEIVKYVAR